MIGAEMVMATELGKRCAPATDTGCWKTISKTILRRTSVNKKRFQKKASANAEGLNRRDRMNLREMVDHVEINDGNNTSDNTHT